MSKILFLFCTAFCFFSATNNLVFAQNTLNPFSYEAAYTGDYVRNLAGGIKTGSCYLGMANLRLNFTTQEANWWKGGQFSVYATNTHGRSPSEELIGDIQVVSNIDGGNHSYLQEVWFKQSLTSCEITIGLQDLNVEFANSEFASLFLNSSFGILPIISGNIPPPIFPLTALGFTVKNRLSDRFTWINALYDGSPTDFDYNPYNVKWQLKKEEGFLAISELQYGAQMFDLPGTYKFGMYSHYHLKETAEEHGIIPTTKHHLFGFYTYADQLIWKKAHKSIGAFLQMGYCPCKGSVNNFYFGTGFNYTGLFNSRGHDVLGLALAYEKLSGKTTGETVLEMSYRYSLNSNIYFQPDVQYILNPSGTDKMLPDSFVAALRLGISF